MKSSKLLFHIVTCGACALAPFSVLAQISTASSSPATAAAYDVPAQIDPSSPVWQQAAIDQEYYVRINPASRTTASFLSDYSVLQSSLVSLGAQVDTQLVGTYSLYLRFKVPTSTNAQRQSLLQNIEQLPLVSQVVADAAANLVIKDIATLSSYTAATFVPESKLRGFRDQEPAGLPDLAQPHRAHVLLVKYLQFAAYNPALLASSQNALHAIHNRLGATIERTIQTADTPIEVVSLPPMMDLGTALLTYQNSPVVEFAHPDYISQAQTYPTNDPAWAGANYGTGGYDLWNLSQINAPGAWIAQTNTGSAVIAVSLTFATGGGAVP